MTDDFDSKDTRFPLEIWYEAFKQKTADQWTMDDICKACGQQIDLETVLPIAVSLLENDPLAGEKFEGHLLSSILRIVTARTPIESSLTARIRRVATSLLKNSDPDVSKDAQEILNRT